MDSMTIPFVVATVLGLITFLPVVIRYLITKYRLRNFKGPRGLPVLGNALQFGSDNASLMKSFLELADKFRENGSFVVYLGLTPVVVVFNAVDMEKILRNTKHDEKGFFSKCFMSPWLGDGLLLSKGSKWATRRKLLTPSFHFSILKEFLVVFNEQARCLTEKFCDLEDEPSVNLPKLISLCSLDIMCETIMGIRLGAQKGESNEYVDAVHRMAALVMERFRIPLYWSNAIFHHSSLGKDHKKSLRILHDTTKQVLCFLIFGSCFCSPCVGLINLLW